ncbi:MAG: ribosome-associated translation inhibitor RaiA [Endomicrobia bacterium]|nr:ribosome-associated translation inhibitor RaiA [Endomicrobiia bacterium]
MEDIKIIARNFELTQEVRIYIEKKFSKITKYVPKISSIEMILKKEKYLYEIELLVHTYHKKIIKITTKDKLLYSAVDVSFDKIKEMLVKYKEKTIVSNKKHSKLNKNATSIESIKQQEKQYRKNEVFLERMTEKQAIKKLSNMEENFLFFFNIDTNSISIAKKVEGEIEISDIRI